MMGKMVPYGRVTHYRPFPYSSSPLKAIGNLQSDYIHFDHSINDSTEKSWLAYFIKDEQIVGVISKNRNTDLLTLYEAMNQSILPPAQMIESGQETPETILKQLRLNKGAGMCKLDKLCRKKQSV